MVEEAPSSHLHNWLASLEKVSICFSSLSMVDTDDDDGGDGDDDDDGGDGDDWI